ncbi:hypothetical protein TCAL_02138, partial [Tigriopus californicus]
SSPGEDGVPASGSLDAIGDDINTTGEVGSSDLERSDSIGDGDGSGTGNGVLDREDRANDDLDGNKPQNLFIKRTVSEDFANNNNGTRRLSSEDNDVEEDMDTSNRGQFGRDVDDPDDESNSKMDYPSLLNMNSISKIPSMLPFSNSSKLESSSVTEHLKEQLQTISMTISQLSSTMTNNSSPKNVQELAVLQATLFSLQQQQLLQMQILSQIQQQQSDRQDSPPSSMPSIAELAKKMERQNSLDQERPKELSALSSLSSSMPLPPSMPAKSNVLTGSGITPTTTQSSGCSKNAKSMHHTSASISSQVLDPNAPPPSLASSIIMHGDSPDDDKPAVNSLELLQKRAQGILNNASQGLLANNLADFSVNRDKEFDKKEPFFKHRCRYCGKVFGSDSALQIHVRSHTGERPYKCNICGNRFTTKGNLKVHFQRHSSKFPHIKMNPNLVPEHLDKFYPPLLQQIEDAEKKGLPIPNVNNPMAGMTPIIPPGMTLPALPNSIPGYPSFSPPPPGLSGSSNGMPRFPMPTSTAAAAAAAAASVSLSLPAPNLPTEPLKREDVPENLARSTPRSRSISPISSRAESRRSPRPMGLEDLKEAIALNRARVHHERSISPHEEKPSPEDMDDQEEPENLTKARTRSVSPPRMDHSPSFPHDRHADSSPANIMPYKTSPSLPMSTASSIIPLPNGPIILPPSVDPAKDPNVYTNLLPRPGSNDNAWESLIEVAKTSETSKLEQLVNNIEHKLSDPNECVICHRVLSCKSALQMHYRTHTGERPFKCRICGRAFTTKGNLKTHMGVHRAKPPMRMFHQCPVCHKKYANALVLQQHIKTHTGEPTELTAEQIAAAEIRDFPPLPFAPGSFPGLGSLRLHGSGLFPNLPHGQFPLGPFGSESQSPDIMDKDDIASGEERENSRPSSVSSTSSSNMKGQHIPTSIPLSLSIDSMVKMSDHRPFSLVRPFLMDKQSPGGPEDLSSPGRKGEQGNGTPEDMEEEPCSSPATLPRCSPGDRNSSPKSEPRDEKRSRDHEKEMRSRREEEQQQRTPTMPKSLADIRSSFPMDLTPNSTAALFAGFPHGLIPQSAIFANPLLSSAPTSALTQLTAASAAFGSPAFNPLGLPFPNIPGGVRPRGNTTCQICFKVFACHSALEIHIRSHTKERPFKCHVCDRGFSTKGNMKQHALTHKTNKDGEILNVSSPMSENSRSDSQDDRSNDAMSSSDRSEQHQQQMQMHPQQQLKPLKRSPPEGAENVMPLPKRSHGPPSNSSLGPNSSSSPPNSPYPSSSPNHGLSSSSLTTPTNSNSTSTSTTSASSNKHNCQVCKKPFSSGSALQIHMRTHTGDRPFKCSVCGKAFTTKGNLKVHMGTHMWSNSNQTSRRGRRMSLEMSHPPIPMNAKDSEFLHRRRPELFFPPPFLPTQFDTNGILPPSTQALQRSLLAEFHNHHQNGTSEDTSEVSRSLAAQPLPPSVRSMSHNHVDDESSPEPIRIRSPHSLHLSPKRKASPSTSQQDPSEENGDRRYSHEPWNWKLSKGDREGRRLIMPTKSDSKLSDRTNSQDEPGVAEDLVTAPAKEDDNDEELEEEGLEEEEEEEEDEEEDSKDVSPCPKSPLPSVPEKIHTSPPTATEIC